MQLLVIRRIVSLAPFVLRHSNNRTGVAAANRPRRHSFLSILRRRHSGICFEESAEIAGFKATDFEGNFTDGQIGLFQQYFRLQDTHIIK